MIHCTVLEIGYGSTNTRISSPFIWMNNASGCTVSPYDWQQRGCISCTDNLQYPKAGCLDVSTMPKTQSCWRGGLPLWFWKWWPPNTTGPSFMRRVEHTSRSHWYTSTAVLGETWALSDASTTGFCLDQKCMSINHFCRRNLERVKKLPDRIDDLHLQVPHLHPRPSSTSFREHSTIGVLQIRSKLQQVHVHQTWTRGKGVT